MKKLIFILIFFPIISIGQNRFEMTFSNADSVFNEIVQKAAIDAARKTDSIFGMNTKPSFYESIWITDISSSKKKNILLSEDDALSLYLSGYMHGQLSYFYNKDFNYDHAYSTLKKIKRELRKDRILDFLKIRH